MQLLLFGLQKSQTSRLELVQSAAGAFSQVQRSADTSPPHWRNCNSFFLIFWDPVQNKSPQSYRLFKRLLQPHTSWARSTSGYTKGLEICPRCTADDSPSCRGCDQSKLFSSDLCCAIPIWERLLPSTLLSSRRTSPEDAEDGTLISLLQDVELWWVLCEAIFDWKRSPSQQFSKLQCEHCSEFPSKSPVYSVFFTGPPGYPSTAERCPFYSLVSYHLQLSVSITQQCWLSRFYHKSHSILYFLSEPPLKAANYKKIPSHFLWWYIIRTVAEKGLGHENLKSQKLH